MARGTRLVSVLVVLVGLFGMHGLVMGTGGCASGMTKVAMTKAAPVVVHAADPMASNECVTLPPTGWPAPALVLLAVVTALGMFVAGQHRILDWPSRAPPGRAGVALLRWLGVSLT